ncbi:molybdopterin guanine dinucleotide-containing S/N-oxide reductase [Candidimonas humi]|uniref:Molybdopterin guanine dinucleotide-containing S/N-oxide reductase n=1 Tax=Candidimonas humi TaxID=683355 RepID=A0ABV8NWW6_9BURK|nr:molybdopterin guanine dinucleotide-containing S/N-oxide reductase [Candidimonas humi]MBV6304845.1 molybdopterin guanine dinucleotide-containing S/N-oxide reductase [Candidimonas humi]
MKEGPHSAHWGTFFARFDGAAISVRPHPADPAPSPLLYNLTNAIRHNVRVPTPMVRRGWLEHGPGPDDRRGNDEYVPVSWDRAIGLVAREIGRVRDLHGPQAIFGGSYGWSSAGRFHHAQSQVHRFLNATLGGYVRSVNNYSAGAAMVIMPHVLGRLDDVARRNVTWDQIVGHTEVVLAFGGMAVRNTQIASGGISQHTEREAMRKAAERGCRFFCISPLRPDLPEEARATWLHPRPGTDTALMLAIMHVLVAEDLHDRAFLDRYCSGWDEFEDYLLGRRDGQPKNPAWASGITGIAAATIIDLAHLLHGKRSLVVVSHSLQRSEHGEQPVWMGVVLACVLGQLGLPGGGYNYALGTLAHYGKRDVAVPISALPQGSNKIDAFIPCARISDMLLNPGGEFDYNGRRYRYPHARLAYWAGGNPFHHHQDLRRLREAFRRLDTLIVHEIAWTATARHADIVLPCTMTLEREDIGGTSTDSLMIAMHRIAPPYAEARDDYDIFADIAEKLGGRAAFTEGRSSRQWLAHLYEPTRAALEKRGDFAPDFDTFWELGELRLPLGEDNGGMLRAFRADPASHPLPTPSGKVQITSPAIASFGYADCPGYPAWLESTDPPTRAYPLYLVANQPATRLHSQLDFGRTSIQSKRGNREVCRIHPADAQARGIADGDIVRLYSARGACLASARITDEVMAGVVQLPTGAWYDPDDAASDNPMCIHGNPNTVTRDIGTSSLAQGCSGQLTAIQVERYDGPLPEVRAHQPPRIATGDGA